MNKMVKEDCWKSQKSIYKNCPLTIRWDGKLLEDIGNKKLLITSPLLHPLKELTSFLVSQKTVSRNRGSIGHGCVYAAVAWNICEQINGTSANSGHWSEACILLENKKKKGMGWCTCRHHIDKNSFRSCCCKCSSRGPDSIFKCFMSHWE